MSGAPPKSKAGMKCEIQPTFSRMAPTTQTQSEKVLRRGKATSRAPIMSGISRLKNAAFRGITARKIIVVPCIVNSSL